jgi:hypothetical protein
MRTHTCCFRWMAALALFSNQVVMRVGNGRPVRVVWLVSSIQPWSGFFIRISWRSNQDTASVRPSQVVVCGETRDSQGLLQHARRQHGCSAVQLVNHDGPHAGHSSSGAC